MIDGKAMDKLTLHRKNLMQAFNPKEAQSALGKQTAFARISMICDAETFVPTLGNAKVTTDEKTVNETLVCGFGKINGQNIGLIVQNYGSLNGSVDIAAIGKAIATIEKSTKSGMPVVFVLDSAGMQIDNSIVTMDAYAGLIRSVVRSSGVVPMIGIIAGPCVGVSSVLASSLDFLIAIKDIAQFGSYSDFVLNANGNYNKNIAMANNGVQFICEDEVAGANKLKELLSYLPANNLQRSSVLESSAKAPITNDYLDAGSLINGIFDDGSVLNLFEEDKSTITAFARIDGLCVGVVAVNEQVNGGVLNINSCSFIAKFVQTCNCYNIPVITFANNNGLALNTFEEQNGLAKAGAKLAFAYGQSVVPMISVITGNCIGSGFVAMGSRGIGNDYVYAFPNAVISPISLEAGVRIMYADKLSNVDNIEQVKNDLTDEYIENYADPFTAAKNGCVDDIVLPSELRQKLISSLAVTLSKRETNFPKKHSNMPV